jgi:hypothetical protein
LRPVQHLLGGVFYVRFRRDILPSAGGCFKGDFGGTDWLNAR